MSSEITSKKRLEKHCDWAFDITTQFRASSDEDSDESDSDRKLATTYTGTGGLLSSCDDLDLSKRDETVAYNPNPFSIAKINAAYRRPTSTAVQPILPVRPSDQQLATTNAGAGGLLIDDLDLSKWEENAAYNPNPFSISKINAAYRRPTTAVQPILPVGPSNQQLATTNIRAGELLTNNLDLSNREENAAAYNPNPVGKSKINAAYRPQASTVSGPLVQATQSVRLANKPTQTSIAKINAAYRPQASTVNGPVVQATQSVRPANKPTQTQQLTKRSRTDSNQTTIMEGFKTQAMKKPRINASFPSASLLSIPSPNYLPKMRIPDDSSSSFMQVKKSYPKRDAYQYSTEDLDEEWTTLPSKKKRKRKLNTGNPTLTKPFHIPGLRLPPTMKAETIATSAAPRMKVYLPPPLNFVDVKRPALDKNSGYSNRIGLSMDETEDRRYVSPSSPTNSYTDAYPSPSTSSSKLSLSFISQAKRARNYTPPLSSRRGVRVVAPYRPPSPPTSDLPIPSDAEDIHVEVDHEGIELRYAEMRRLSRKRRRASADVWNLMGVDSCGYVWKDVEGGGGQGEQTEIQIVVWTGLPPA